MAIRKLEIACVLSLAITASSVHADRMIFTGQKVGDNLTDAANWQNETHPDKSGIPDADDTVVLSGGRVAKITSAFTVGYFQSGVNGAGNGAGQVIIDGGTLRTTGTDDYNSVSYNYPSSMTVQNGGSAIFNSRLLVGNKDFQGAAMVIHEGRVRVANMYYHNENYTGTEPLNTRTTINTGGLLDVDELILNSGVMDIAGGTLIVRKQLFSIYVVNQWINEGRLIAMGGEAGWKIKMTVNNTTGWTTITAEFAPEPLTVGRLDPLMTTPARPAA